MATRHNQINVAQIEDLLSILICGYARLNFCILHFPILLLSKKKKK